MSLKLTTRLVVAAVSVLLLAGVPAQYAVAASPSANVTADQARLDRALARLDAVRARKARLEARIESASTRLDTLIARQEAARDRLQARSAAMYRMGDTSFVSLLLGSASFEEFAARWDLLTRMNRQDAVDLQALAKARREAERSASSLLRLQAEQAKATDEVAREVAAAKRELAASKSALLAYEAHVTPRIPSVGRKKKADGTQKLQGTGAWKTATASHYGRNFTGRGASGEEIGPYSMIVAHKTLPFGTLVEIEYNGKRAVAKVADRGPYTAGRDFDLGPGVVRVLDFAGVQKIRYRIIER